MLLFAALLGIRLVNAVQEPTVVPVHKEPRHHVVYESAAARVLDVQIPVGDTTLFHTHRTPIHYVQVGVTETTAQILGQGWQSRVGEPGRIGLALSITSYVHDPLTHRVANVGSALYRLIAIENLGDGVMGSVEDATASPEYEEVNRWFRRRRVTLEPDATTEWETAERSVLLVQTSAGAFELDNRTGGQRGAAAIGEWLVMDAGTSYRLRNVGNGAVELVMVEVR